MSWIACSEMMPDDGKLVWIDSPEQAGIGCITDMITYFADDAVHYDSELGWVTGGDFTMADDSATSWQPLPSPPCI